MAEEGINPEEIGRRIAADYLSGIGWTRERRRVIGQEIIPEWTREDRENRFRQCDSMEDAAETKFSSEIEKWRKDPTEAATKVMKKIYEMLKGRTDLTFLGKSIVGHLKRELGRRGEI
jgi:hypothetical protein